MSASENAALAKLAGIRDPLERAEAAHAFITRGEEVLTEARKIRTAAIRKVWNTPPPSDGTKRTHDSIAAHIKASRWTVVDALRPEKEASR